VRKHHTFFWDTGLTDERMAGIDDFLASLTDDQKKMIK